MKQISCVLIFAFMFLNINAQESDRDSIKNSIIGFLNWHKKNGLNEKKSNQYAIVRDVKIAGNLKKQVIDKMGIERYLDFFRSSKFLSEIYINNLRGYFYEIDIRLRKSPPIGVKSIVKIDGLDLDFILQSFEPDEVLSHIDEGDLGEVLVLNNKAIAKFYIPQSSIKMLYTLTKQNRVWLIDFIGYYN